MKSLTSRTNLRQCRVGEVLVIVNDNPPNSGVLDGNLPCVSVGSVDHGTESSGTGHDDAVDTELVLLFSFFHPAIPFCPPIATSGLGGILGAEALSQSVSRSDSVLGGQTLSLTPMAFDAFPSSLPISSRSTRVRLTSSPRAAFFCKKSAPSGSSSVLTGASKLRGHAGATAAWCGAIQIPSLQAQRDSLSTERSWLSSRATKMATRVDPFLGVPDQLWRCRSLRQPPCPDRPRGFVAQAGHRWDHGRPK